MNQSENKIFSKSNNNDFVSSKSDMNNIVNETIGNTSNSYFDEQQQYQYNYNTSSDGDNETPVNIIDHREFFIREFENSFNALMSRGCNSMETKITPTLYQTMILSVELADMMTASFLDHGNLRTSEDIKNILRDKMEKCKTFSTSALND